MDDILSKPISRHCNTCSSDIRFIQNRCCLKECIWFKDREYRKQSGPVPSSSKSSSNASGNNDKENEFPAEHQHNILSTTMSQSTLPELLDFMVKDKGRSVISRVGIRTKSVFGPLIAPLIVQDQLPDSSTSPRGNFAFNHSKMGIVGHYLNSDSDCNWMKFVSVVSEMSHANLLAFSFCDNRVYFVTTRDISIGETLCVFHAGKFGGHHEAPEETPISDGVLAGTSEIQTDSQRDRSCSPEIPEPPPRQPRRPVPTTSAEPKRKSLTPARAECSRSVKLINANGFTVEEFTIYDDCHDGSSGQDVNCEPEIPKRKGRGRPPLPPEMRKPRNGKRTCRICKTYQTSNGTAMRKHHETCNVGKGFPRKRALGEMEEQLEKKIMEDHLKQYRPICPKDPLPSGILPWSSSNENGNDSQEPKETDAAAGNGDTLNDSIDIDLDAINLDPNDMDLDAFDSLAPSDTEMERDDGSSSDDESTDRPVRRKQRRVRTKATVRGPKLGRWYRTCQKCCVYQTTSGAAMIKHRRACKAPASRSGPPAEIKAPTGQNELMSNEGKGIDVDASVSLGPSDVGKYPVENLNGTNEEGCTDPTAATKRRGRPRALVKGPKAGRWHRTCQRCYVYQTTSGASMVKHRLACEGPPLWEEPTEFEGPGGNQLKPIEETMTNNIQPLMFMPDADGNLVPVDPASVTVVDESPGTAVADFVDAVLLDKILEPSLDLGTAENVDGNGNVSEAGNPEVTAAPKKRKGRPPNPNLVRPRKYLRSCKWCNTFTTSSGTALAKHRRICDMNPGADPNDPVRSEKPFLGYPCLYCNQLLMPPKSREHYESMHRVEGHYTCPWPGCSGNFFAEVGGLRQHYGKHQNKAELERLRAEGKLHQCHICGYQATTDAVIKAHMDIHANVQHICPHCQESFAQKGGLNYHVRRYHTSSQPLRIHQLLPKKRTFANRNDWTTFFYKCERCQLGLNTRKQLVQHLNAIHPDVSHSSIPELNLPMRVTKRIHCVICGSRFDDEELAKKHVDKRHTEEALYEFNKGRTKNKESFFYNGFLKLADASLHYCEICNGEFDTARALLHHCRMQHPDYLKVLMPHLPPDTKFMVWSEKKPKRDAMKRARLEAQQNGQGPGPSNGRKKQAEPSSSEESEEEPTADSDTESDS